MAKVQFIDSLQGYPIFAARASKTQAGTDIDTALGNKQDLLGIDGTSGSATKFLNQKGSWVSGPLGPSGPTGATGATGPCGPKGFCGPIGLTGATGPCGPQGNTGATGPCGPIGLTGACGPSGAKGLCGPIGVTGPCGPRGFCGPKGDTGACGPAGPVVVDQTYSATSTNAQSGKAVAAAIEGLDVSSVGGDGKYISAISETDGKISATATTMDTTPTANSTKAVTSGGIKTALGNYLPLSGGTMTGKITALGSQYTDSYTGGAIDMQNSNIVGLNSIYTCDTSENASEGIHFYRDATHTDTLWMAGGHMYFVPNRTLAGSAASTSAADSKKVAILPASITSGQVVTTDGTSGDVKGVDASTLSVGSATKDGDGNTISGTYLKLAGGTMTGTINTPTNAVSINFRNNEQYHTTASYQTSGNEALVFATKMAVTSFMFVNGEDSVTYHGNDRWLSLTPGLQVKQNCVSIGKLIANNVSPTYKLEVNGTVRGTSYNVDGGCTIQYNSTTSALDFVFA